MVGGNGSQRYVHQEFVAWDLVYKKLGAFIPRRNTRTFFSGTNQVGRGVGSRRVSGKNESTLHKNNILLGMAAVLLTFGGFKVSQRGEGGNVKHAQNYDYGL